MKLFTLHINPSGTVLDCAAKTQAWCDARGHEFRILGESDIPEPLRVLIPTLGIRIVSDWFRVEYRPGWVWIDWDAYPTDSAVIPDGFCFAPMVDNCFRSGPYADRIKQYMGEPRNREGCIWYAVKRLLKELYSESGTGEYAEWVEQFKISGIVHLNISGSSS